MYEKENLNSFLIRFKSIFSEFESFMTTQYPDLKIASNTDRKYPEGIESFMVFGGDDIYKLEDSVYKNDYKYWFR